MNAKLPERLPTARTVRDVLGYVNVGGMCGYRVAHDNRDAARNERFRWRVYGPCGPDGCRDIIDEFATYREAVRFARAALRDAKEER